MPDLLFEWVPKRERALFALGPLRTLHRRELSLRVLKSSKAPTHSKKSKFIAVCASQGEARVMRFQASRNELRRKARDLAAKTDDLVLVGEYAGMTPQGVPVYSSIARAMTDVAKARRDPLSDEALSMWIHRSSRRLMGRAARETRDMIDEMLEWVDFEWATASGEMWATAKAGIEGTFSSPSAGMIFAQRVQTGRVLQQVIRQTTRGAARIPAVAANIGASFRLNNRQISRAMMHHHGFFVRDQYGRIAPGLAGQVQPIIASGLDRGLGRVEISRELRSRMTDGLRMRGYWETVASNAVSRSRSYSLGASFRAAGIDLFRIYAIVDEQTTETCLMLHDQVLSVGRAMNNLETAMASNRPEDTLSLLPFVVQEGNEFVTKYPDGSSSLIATRTESGQYNRVPPGRMASAGIGFPPYHHRCRTTVIPEVT